MICLEKELRIPKSVLKEFRISFFLEVSTQQNDISRNTSILYQLKGRLLLLKVTYSSDAGESYQMDWGFVQVNTSEGGSYKVACFAMICHHCGERYIEFFPNTKQENLFIGMIHAFKRMGIPQQYLWSKILNPKTGILLWGTI